MNHAVGIDIGGTSIKLGTVSPEEGRVICEGEPVPTYPDEGGPSLVARIAEATKAMIKDCNVPVSGAGVGCPGTIDSDNGVVRRSPNLPALNGYALQEELKRALRLPVKIDNDANAAVLGEFLFGPTQGVRNLILLTLGTGVGGGVIVDGRLLRGADNAAAELGHLKIQPDGERCGCGKAGCLEAYVGSAGIVRIARRYLSRGSGLGLPNDSLSTKTIAEAARRKNVVARNILEEVGRHLGRAIATLIDVFNPEKILLGGGASAAFEFFHPGIKTAVMEYASFSETRDRTVIQRAAFPDSINLLGAAATFFAAVREENLAQR